MSNDEIAAARSAIAAGQYDTARHHINNLAMDGAHQQEVEELTRLVYWKENANSQQNLARLGTAIAVAVLGYMVLSFQAPAAWGPLVWGLTAFLVLPAFAGILAGGGGGPTGQRFWRAFGIVACSMAIYAIVGMAIARSKMHSSDKSSDFFLYLVVAVVYAVIAGMVAGVSGTMFKGPKVVQ